LNEPCGDCLSREPTALAPTPELARPGTESGPRTMKSGTAPGAPAAAGQLLASHPATPALEKVVTLFPALLGPAPRQKTSRSPARSPTRRGLRSLARAVQAEGRRADRDRHRAEALYPALLAMEPARRLDRIARSRRFASPALARLLLAEAGAGARNRPAEARELADLALAVVVRLEADRSGTITVVALRAAAHARRAEALWWGGDSTMAEAALAASLADLDATPIGEPEHALYCRVAALLRAGEGRLDEALALLGRAAQLYRDQEEVEELALCLIERGWLLVAEEPDAALLPLWNARDLLARDAASGTLWAAVRVRQGLALCLAELGRPLEAAPLQREARDLAQGLAEEPDQLLAAWTDAQIDARIGRPRQAMEALPPLVERWLARGEGFSAALAALDLAELYVETGRWLDLVDLERLEPRLRAAGLPAEAALAYRAVVGLAHREPPSATYPLVHLRTWLGRARHRPGLAYVPCRSAARTRRWDDLHLPTRQEICRLAGADLRTAALPAAGVAPDLRKLLAWTHLESTGDRIEWDGMDESRADLRRVVERLRAAEAELRRIAAALPLPSDGECEETVAHRRPPHPPLSSPAALPPLPSRLPLPPLLSLPPTAAVLLAGAIDHTIAAHLAPAIADLDDAAGDPGSAARAGLTGGAGLEVGR
jgi:tetratricopeptide (TPR) repeat protein